MDSLPIELIQELINFSLNPNDTIDENFKNYFEILRKYGVKKGQKNESGGILMNTPEWTICSEMLKKSFIKLIDKEITLGFSSEIPKDLEY